MFARARIIKQRMEALAGQIPGLLKIEIGIDTAAVASSSDIVLYSEFSSREALAAYQAHPLHKAIIPFAVEAQNERRMVDYEVD